MHIRMCSGQRFSPGSPGFELWLRHLFSLTWAFFLFMRAPFLLLWAFFPHKLVSAVCGLSLGPQPPKKREKNGQCIYVLLLIMGPMVRSRNSSDGPNINGELLGGLPGSNPSHSNVVVTMDYPTSRAKNFQPGQASWVTNHGWEVQLRSIAGWPCLQTSWCSVGSKLSTSITGTALKKVSPWMP